MRVACHPKLREEMDGVPAEAANWAVRLRQGFGGCAFTAARRRLAGATGLEPATYGVTGRHSNQLSYAPAGARGRKTRISREGRSM